MDMYGGVMMGVFESLKKFTFKRTIALGSALAVSATLTGCYDEVEANDISDDLQNSTGSSDNKVEANGVSEKPNVVYIVLDDVGFGDLGCYGSSISTPNMDELAKNGVLYSNFNATPLSSPSRASLLTGNDSNLVGMGAVSDIDMGDVVSNVHARVYPEYGTIAQTLQIEGYDTIQVGKWHLGPYDEFGPDGDKAFWPSGMGFNKNYSFIGNQTNQFEPGSMFEGDKYTVADTSKSDYHLTNDLVDHSLKYIDESEKDNFFLYFNLGAMHGPLQVSKSYIEKYEGKFEHGWDVEREKIFNKQKSLGIFNEQVELPSRDENIPAWESLNDKEKAVFQRHMEVYAGFLEHTDDQLGRLFEELKERDKYDNTIFVLLSDNGANSNGGRDGSVIAHTVENFFVYDIDKQFEALDEFGSVKYGTQYNTGWAMTSNTPFKEYKQKAFYGGIRVPAVVSWKNGVESPGRIVNELTMIQDITPTIYDVLNVEHPEEINGVVQAEKQGLSIKKSLDAEKLDFNNREAGFMMFQERAYSDGSGYMIAVNPKSTEWEMFDTENDPTQIYDIKEEHPEKFKELLAKWDVYKKEQMDSENIVYDLAHGVPPNVIIQRHGDLAKDVFNTMKTGTVPKLEETKEILRILKFVNYVPENGLGYKGAGIFMYIPKTSKLSAKEYIYNKEDGYFSSLSAARTNSVSHTINTMIEVDEQSKGVILANGGVDGGYVLYVDNDRHLVYEYNYSGTLQKIVSKEKLQVGNAKIDFNYEKTSLNEGDIILKVDEETVASGSIKTLPVMLSFDYFSIGEDVAANVSESYTGNFEYTDDIHEIQISLGNDKIVISK